jgi:hypothetical protein
MQHEAQHGNPFRPPEHYALDGSAELHHVRTLIDRGTERTVVVTS